MRLKRYSGSFDFLVLAKAFVFDFESGLPSTSTITSLMVIMVLSGRRYSSLVREIYILLNWVSNIMEDGNVNTKENRYFDF